MGWATWSLASAVLERTGKRVFVDTARDHQRPKFLATHPRLEVKVIHLIRDPRGNAASIMKHAGESVEAGRAYVAAYVDYVKFVEEADRLARLGAPHAHHDEPAQ
jgi:hypothetical protein